VVALKISDVDSERMALRIEQGKGRRCIHDIWGYDQPFSYWPIAGNADRSIPDISTARFNETSLHILLTRATETFLICDDRFQFSMPASMFKANSEPVSIAK
jgi:hypothetical protein